MTAIKRVLKEKGVSIHELHKRVRGNRTNVYEIAKGFSRATAPRQERIARALGVRIREIFDENGMARKA